MLKLPPSSFLFHQLLIAVLVTATLLIWPALLLNNAPLIFSDTIDYLAMGVGAERPIRPRGYSWFVAPAWLTGSLWPVVVLQSVLTAGLVHAVLRTTLPKIGIRSHLCSGLGLAAFTTVPWAVSYVMPDALTAPALLALFLVLVLPAGLHVRLMLSASVVCLATASHITHLLTALAVVGALALGRLLGGPALVRPGRLTLALAATILGPVSGIGANMILTGHAEYARGSSVFLAARLAGDGALQRYLYDVCPQPELPHLCAAREHIPHDADHFLWARDWLPETRLREGEGVFDAAWEAELAVANRSTLRAYWLDWMSASFKNSLEQFVTLNAGDGLDRDLALNWGSSLSGLISPASAAAALASRQAREELAGHPLAALPGPIAIAAIVASGVGVIGWARPLARCHAAALFFLAFVVLGASANAGAIGFGGAVHARYQARIAWLFPLAAGIIWSAIWQVRQATMLPDAPSFPMMRPSSKR